MQRWKGSISKCWFWHQYWIDYIYYFKQLTNLRNLLKRSSRRLHFLCQTLHRLWCPLGGAHGKHFPPYWRKAKPFRKWIWLASKVRASPKRFPRKALRSYRLKSIQPWPLQIYTSASCSEPLREHEQTQGTVIKIKHYTALARVVQNLANKLNWSFGHLMTFIDGKHDFNVEKPWNLNF